MKLSTRLLRRLIIGFIFLAVFSLTGLGLKTAVTPTPTCNDGAMNGQEEGVDCGLFACNKYCEPDLAPPTIASTKLIKAGEGDYDFVAEIVNPHKDFGASEVAYELKLLNADKAELFKREDVFYILPGQTKFLILPHLTTENNVSSIELNIKSAKWQKIESLEGMNLLVKNEKYVSTGPASGQLNAVIFNDSDFEFELVDIDIVLYNSRGDIIAVNKSDIRTFVARTERAFSVVWPFSINGTVSKILVKPSTNLFENSNFIKSYGSEVEKFQKYEFNVN